MATRYILVRVGNTYAKVPIEVGGPPHECPTDPPPIGGDYVTRPEFNQAISNINNHISSIASKTDELEDRIEALENATPEPVDLTEITERLDTADARLDDHDAALADHEARLADLEQCCQDVQEIIGKHELDIADLQTDVTDLKDRVTALESTDGGSSGLIVLDEGNEVAAHATILNFVGAEVKAQPGQNGNIVDVYIPPPTYVSHFNTTDGDSDARVADEATSNRYVAAPTEEGTPYKVGDWNLAVKHPVVSAGVLTYSTPEAFSIRDDKSTVFTVSVLDADNTTILRSHSVTLTGDYSETKDDIKITVSDFASDANRFKAKVNAEINIAAILPQGGRFSVRLTHNNGADGLFEKKQENIFYDANINKPKLSGLTVEEAVPVIRHLSGVKYYTAGSQFSVNLADADYLNDSSYGDMLIELDSTNLGLPVIKVGRTDAGLSGWTNAWNNQDASYAKNDWAIVQSNHYYQGAGANVKARPYDFTAGNWITSPNMSVLVDTYTDNSTRILEDFRSETNRLTSDYAAWDSTKDLRSYDGSNGLQVAGSRLIYPKDNYMSYAPDTNKQPDYSGCTGERTYIRRFWHQNVSHSNGILRFSDHNLTEAKFAQGDFRIELSLDGTEWYTLGAEYDGGILTDGDGCRINTGQYNLDVNNQISFSLGLNKFTDEASDWGIYLRITFADSAAGKNLYMGSIELTDWV